MTYEVVELMTNGLKFVARNVLSRLLRDEKSDSCFRLNRYPSCSELQELSRRNLIGFGEHTDPQIFCCRVKLVATLLIQEIGLVWSARCSWRAHQLWLHRMICLMESIIHVIIQNKKLLSDIC